MPGSFAYGVPYVFSTLQHQKIHIANPINISDGMNCYGSERLQSVGGIHYCYSNTFIDHFSCFPWVYCTRTKLPDEVLKNLDNLFDNFGICDILQSDNGGEFTADRVNEYLQHLNIKFVHGKPRTPREQGKVEKFNGTQSLSRSFASLHCQI